MIDTRGWDAMRWTTANHRYLYFVTETTVTSDNWLTGDNDGSGGGITLTAGSTFARIFNADGTYGSRNKLLQIITDGTKHYQIWKRGTVDEGISQTDGSTTGMNGTQLYQTFWPSNYKVGTGSEGNGRPTGKSYFAEDTSGNTTSLGTNAEIISMPTQTFSQASVQAALSETYMYGEFMIELFEPWDPSVYEEADTHEHTIANMGPTIDSPYYTGDVVERADYRPAFYKGSADGFAMSRRSSGFCTNPPPFVALREKLLYSGPGVNTRNQQLAAFDLYVDLYRSSPHKIDIGGGHELQNRERGNAWNKATSEE